VRQGLAVALCLASCGSSAASSEATVDAMVVDLARAPDAQPADTVDAPAADASPVVPFVREGRSWQLHQVDPIGGAPIFPTLAIGPAGPAVAFRKGTPDERYPVVSRWDGAAWSPPETIEREADTFLGKRPALVLDRDDRLHLIYYNEDATRLRYATRPAAASTWTLSYPYD
jgi:hypothetical protein